MHIKFRLALFLSLLLSAVFLVTATTQSRAQDARIEFKVFKAGLIIGVGGGSGTLFYGGNAYPLTISGVSLGAQIGVTVTNLQGTVHNLHNVADIAGAYGAATAGAAIIVGPAVAQLSNGKGVLLKVSGGQVGLAVSLNLAGLTIGLK